MGALEIVVGAFLAIATGAVAILLANELTFLCEALAKRLVRRAARRLPEGHRAEYEAEWLQYVIDIRSPVGKLLHGADLYFRAGRIASGIGFPRFAKRTLWTVRILDIVFAAAALVVLAPLLLLVVGAIYLDSKGPISAIRKMTGRGGKTIRVFEFRTTVPNGGGVTRVGRALRVLNLDVLPRIVNVLYGDLSFVGPKVGVEKEVDGQLSELRPGIVSPEAFASDDPWGELKTSFGAGYWFRTIGKTISFSIKLMRRPPR